MATSTHIRAFLPDDLLTAILELARQAKGDRTLRFRGHDEDLQTIFHDLAQDVRFGLLSSFVFSSTGPRPYSPALNDSVSKLQLAGLLGRQNPDYEIVFTTPAAQSYYESVLSSRFSSAQTAQLRDIAKEFLSRIESM